MPHPGIMLYFPYSRKATLLIRDSNIYSLLKDPALHVGSSGSLIRIELVIPISLYLYSLRGTYPFLGSHPIGL